MGVQKRHIINLKNGITNKALKNSNNLRLNLNKTKIKIYLD